MKIISWLMMFKEIIVIYSVILNPQIHSVRRVQLLIVSADGTHSYHLWFKELKENAECWYLAKNRNFKVRKQHTYFSIVFSL